MQVLILPPMPWQPYRNSFTPGSGPDPMEIYGHLAAEGIETTLLDPNPRPWNMFAGKNTLLESLDPLRALRVLLLNRHFDIVISVFEGAAASLLPLRRVLGFRGKIVLWDVGLTENWRLRERILDYVLPRVDGVLVLGSNQKPYIEKRWQPAGAVRVVFHHVDARFFHPESPVADGPILCVGEDVGRDFGGLIAAVEGIDCDVVVKTRRRLDGLDGRRHPRLRVLSDWLSYVELRSLYASSLMVAVPLAETLNASGVSTILEASAMGKALVVSDSAAIREYIVPGETCLTVPCGDQAALHDAIQRLVADPDLRYRLGRRAREFVESRFAKPAFARHFGNTLREILNS